MGIVSEMGIVYRLENSGENANLQLASAIKSIQRPKERLGTI
jgi:hypothetical protein